jgi:hypothetical protein
MRKLRMTIVCEYEARPENYFGIAPISLQEMANQDQGMADDDADGYIRLLSTRDFTLTIEPVTQS